MRRTVTAVIGIAVAATVLTGCNKSTYQCNSGSCEVKVSGNVSVDLGTRATRSSRHDHDVDSPDSFEVTGYDGDAVRISSNGDEAAVRTGESKRIGELNFRVESVNGDSAKLHVDM